MEPVGSDETSRPRRFGASRIQRRQPVVTPEVLDETQPPTPPVGDQRNVYSPPPIEESVAGGSRFGVVGCSPGCLLASLVLSIVFTLILNAVLHVL